MSGGVGKRAKSGNWIGYSKKRCLYQKCKKRIRSDPNGEFCNKHWRVG